MTTDRKVVSYKPLTLVRGSWHLAITKGTSEWLEAVTDEDYAKLG